MQTSYPATEAKDKVGPNTPVLHCFLPNAPLMCVVGPEYVKDNTRQGKRINGIRCYWFTPEGHYISDLFHSDVIRRATDSEIAHIQGLYSASLPKADGN